MSAVKLKYGLRAGELVHVSREDVKSGLACGCCCPACDAELLAKKGPKRDDHYSHRPGSDCGAAVETALHYQAKALLDKYRYLKIPPVAITFDTNRSALKIADERYLNIESMRIEKRVGEIVPDLIATVNGRDLFIEVFVTHPVDAEKLSVIKGMGVSCIEIDLSSVDRDLSMESMKSLVIDETSNKRWLFNARAEYEKGRMLNQSLGKGVIYRGMAMHVDGCPLAVRIWRGKPYANVIDDCIYCKRCVSYRDSEVFCDGHLSEAQLYRPRVC